MIRLKFAGVAEVTRFFFTHIAGCLVVSFAVMSIAVGQTTPTTPVNDVITPAVAATLSGDRGIIGGCSNKFRGWVDVSPCSGGNGTG